MLTTTRHAARNARLEHSAWHHLLGKPCASNFGAAPASTPDRPPAAVSKVVGVAGGAMEQVVEESRGTYPGAVSDMQKPPAQGGRG